MNAEMDVSLYGDSLKQWNDWISSLQQQESLLRWAIGLNKAAVAISMPLWMIARIIGIPLQFMHLITFGLLTALLEIALWPVMQLVLSSCKIWPRTPATRPILLLVVPIAVAVAMILISMIPCREDIRDTRYILCELWPLSHRRMEWIDVHGTGKVVKVGRL